MLSVHKLSTIASRACLCKCTDVLSLTSSNPNVRSASTKLSGRFKFSNSLPTESEKVLVRMNQNSNLNVDVDATWLRKNSLYNCKTTGSNKLKDSSLEEISAVNEAGEGDWFEVIWRDGQVSWFNKEWIWDHYIKH